MRSTPVRTRKSPAQRRNEVATTAAELAREQGLAAVTLRAIAARMGVAPGLVAHYAPSMDELVASTFTSVVGAELDDVRAIRERFSDNPEAAIGGILDTLLDGTRDDVTLVWVQAWALGSGNDLLAAAVRAEMDRWQVEIAAAVGEGVRQGRFTSAEPDAVAWLILAIVDGVNAHSLVGWREMPDRRHLARSSVAALLGVEPAALR